METSIVSSAVTRRRTDTFVQFILNTLTNRGPDDTKYCIGNVFLCHVGFEDFAAL